MTNLANYTPPHGPSPMTREQETTLATYRNRLERNDGGYYSISDQKAPSDHVRLDFESRRNEIAVAIQKSDPRSVVQRISRLFMRFPSTRLDGNTEATMAAYATDLSVYPIWVIDAACKEVIEGRLDRSKAFAPSSIELRTICDMVIMPFRCEQREINDILNAEVYHEPTPEARAKVLQEFRALVEELKMNEDPIDRARNKSRPLTKSEAQAALNRSLANPQPVPKFSPALRRVLGLPESDAKDEAAA